MIDKPLYNEELEAALRLDPLVEAEKMTGLSYKESELTSMLGLGIQMQHSKTKANLLALNRDTDAYRQNWVEFTATIESMGFELVLSDDVVNEKDGWTDKFNLYWREDGLLLEANSYFNQKSPNGAKVHFNYRGSGEAMNRCSYGYRGEVDGVRVWSGNYDCREALRHFLDTMLADGQFLPQWIDQPFLWLVDYVQQNKANESKEANDYSIPREERYHVRHTNERIARLPEHVRAAITPQPVLQPA